MVSDIGAPELFAHFHIVVIFDQGEVAFLGRTTPADALLLLRGAKSSSSLGRNDKKSKLARVLFRPALHYHFLFGVKLDGIASLAVHNAEETVFPSTERKVGHGSGYADVDADVPCRGF